MKKTRPIFETCLDKTPDDKQYSKYEGWNFNSGNYLFATDTK